MHLRSIALHPERFPTRECYPFSLLILLHCPGASIHSFDRVPIASVRYEDTDHYRTMRDFMAGR